MSFFSRFLTAFVLLVVGLGLAFAPGSSPAWAQTAPPRVSATPVAANAPAGPATAMAPSKPGHNLSGTLAQKAQSFGGWVAFVVICFGIGRWQNPKLRPMLRTVLWGMALQVLFALAVLKIPRFFETVNGGVDALLSFSREGGKFCSAIWSI